MSNDTQATGTFKFDDLLDRQTLQQLQDGFAAVTGKTVMLLRPDGSLVTEPSYGGPVCELIGQSTVGARLGAEGAYKAAQSVERRRHDNQAVHVTHDGIEQFAAPITVNGQHLATLVMGYPCYGNDDQHLQHLARQFEIPVKQLRQARLKKAAEPNMQTSAAVKFLESFANTLGKLSSQEKSRRQRIRELGILHQFASMLAGRSDLDQILHIIAEQVVSAMNVRACSIRIYNAETRELQVKAVARLSKTYLDKGPVKLDNSPIDMAALAGEVVYIEDMATDRRVLYPQQARKEGLVSGLAVGMLYRGAPVGVIHTYTARRHVFDQYEQQCLRAIASQAASAITNARLHEEAHEAERMQRQLQLAGEVQRRMLPDRPPRRPGLDIGYVYEPCFAVGGDFYDFIELSPTTLALTIADVAGKGVPASLQMACLRASLRAFAGQPGEIQQTISRLNRSFCRDTLISEFVTLFYGVLDVRNQTLTYVNAGHNPPLLIRQRQVIPLPASGMAVGVDPQADYRHRTLPIRPGDVMVLYTDGLIDAMTFDGRQFGRKRLTQSIFRYIDQDAQHLANNMLWDVRRFVGLATQNDDMSLVVVKIQEP